MRHRKMIQMDFICLYGLTKIWTCYGTQQEGEVLHVYLDHESQHHLISCMKMVAVSGYASGYATDMNQDMNQDMHQDQGDASHVR